MLRTGSSVQTLTPRSTNRPWLFSDRGRSRMEPNSRRFVLGVALGVGLVSFLATEPLHYWLVPDLGRHQERLLAEGLSALIVSCLVAKLASVTPTATSANRRQDTGDCRDESSHPERSDSHLPFGRRD